MTLIWKMAKTCGNAANAATKNADVAAALASQADDAKKVTLVTSNYLLSFQSKPQQIKMSCGPATAWHFLIWVEVMKLPDTSG